MTTSAREGFELVARLGGAEHGLAVVVTTRRDGEPSTSVVNAGVLAHPVSGEMVVGFVALGGSAKLVNLRRHARATLVFRSGWEWVAVAGGVDLAGPDDALPGLASGAVPQLLRDVFHAAGGTHDDLDEYDRVMAAERRAAVFVRPDRFTTNP